MVRNFRGQVRISDVQDEFNNLVDGINNMVSTYNAAVKDTGSIDYTKGGTTLAPLGYTLTIGGLKQVLKLYDGTVLGSEVYKIADENYIVSNGLYIKDEKVIRLNQGLVQGSGDILYYDLTHNAYTFGDKYVASSTGGATIVSKPWTQPVLTSNTTWGVVGQEGPMGYFAWDGPDKGKVFALFNNSTLIAMQTIPKDFNQDIIWKFQEPLKVTKVSLTALGFCTYNLDQEGHSPVALQILDSDNERVLASRNLTKTNTRYEIPIDTTDPINGVIIRAVFTGDAAMRNYWIGKIKLEAEDIQEISLPDTTSGDIDKNNLIKVSDLNTNRIVKLCNTPNFTAENIEGFKLGAKGFNVNYYDVSVSGLANSTKGQFLSVLRESSYREGEKYTTMFGERVAGGKFTDDNIAAFFGGITRLFLPKGIKNPFSNVQWQAVTDYIVKRQPFKQK